MKRFVFIAIFGISSVYFVGCGVSEDYSHLPECRFTWDYDKGCLDIYNHESGKYRREIPYKNGKREGIAREYFADKTICEIKLVDSIAVNASVCINKDGKPKSGVMKEYYDNGNLALEYMFKNGRKEGAIKLYYENGALMTETPYKDGKREGVVKKYYPNGNLEMEMSYKNGKKEGVVKEYNYNGKLIWEYHI